MSRMTPAEEAKIRKLLADRDPMTYAAFASLYADKLLEEINTLRDQLDEMRDLKEIAQASVARAEWYIQLLGKTLEFYVLEGGDDAGERGIQALHLLKRIRIWEPDAES